MSLLRGAVHVELTQLIETSRNILKNVLMHGTIEIIMVTVTLRRLHSILHIMFKTRSKRVL